MSQVPQPEHKFAFGLWTIGNIVLDPFGEPTRTPLSPVEIAHTLVEVGARPCHQTSTPHIASASRS